MERRPAKFGDGEAYRWLLEHAKHRGNDCLIWPFSRDGRVGRGRLGHEGKNWWAHRLMCKLAHGEPPTPKHQAAHNCGNGHSGCVNPTHLEWKTNAQNQADRRQHGTHLGAIGTRTNLTRDQIAEMRALKGKMTQLQIAEKFGVKLGRVEYWHKHSRDPLPPGKSPDAIRRRMRNSNLNNGSQ